MSNSTSNDANCPCNSGRKYGNCHGRQPFIIPKEKFSLKVDSKKQPPIQPTIITMPDGRQFVSEKYHLVTRGLTNRKQDPSIQELLKAIVDTIPETTPILKKRLERLEHKLNGVKYHLDNFILNETTTIENYRTTDYVSQTNVILEVREPKLMYEIEGFLFQVKSSLDVLAQIIGMIYSLQIGKTYRKNGSVLINSLRQSAPKNMDDKAQKLAKILEDYQQWVKETIEMRNEITHDSELVGFGCFIEDEWKGADTVDIYYPSMLDGSRARNYLEITYKTLLKLIQEISSCLIISKN